MDERAAPLEGAHQSVEVGEVDDPGGRVVDGASVDRDHVVAPREGSEEDGAEVAGGSGEGDAHGCSLRAGPDASSRARGHGR
ncbi:MAG: hypothetical protein AVDCRST_MAG79-2898 [uncultured Thermoleophilia bacterium]|uniref:Uncharacterized protein n=1 Tax=uncultured Thermoleophilia bacterium TaxID=1497501 RepID=A0A6J4UN11_9ACTN|nr:MAG: hypothetical protein AVDCRST_MAG79-2898 [uncultured Thermoleophilia bacterium]